MMQCILLAIIDIEVQQLSRTLVNWAMNLFVKLCLFLKNVVPRSSFRDIILPFRLLPMLSSHLSIGLILGSSSSQFTYT